MMLGGKSSNNVTKGFHYLSLLKISLKEHWIQGQNEKNILF